MVPETSAARAQDALGDTGDPAAGGASHVRPAVWMFPGLGDHYVDMGLGLYQIEPLFREAIDRCCELLVPEVGMDLRQVLYPDPKRTVPATSPGGGQGGLDLRRLFGRAQEEPDAASRRLNQTYLTQPALFVVEYALARLWLGRGLRIGAMIGYSLGEYVAACLAGVLLLEDSLKLVARRAQLIDKLPGGAMLAVLLPEAQILPLLGGHLSLCAINGPELCVVGGPHEAVAALEERLKKEGAVSRRVQSSHAFHSTMMEPIAEELSRLAATFPRRPPAIPYISNVTGALITAEQAMDPSYFSVHLCRPVQFAPGIRLLWQKPEHVFVEVGPGQTLSSLAIQNVPAQGAAESVVVSTLRHALDSQPDAAVLAKAATRLQAAGALVGDAQPQVEGQEVRARQLPQSEVEKTLAAAWQALLRKEGLSLDADFFALGGSSLIATRLMLRIRKAFRVELPLRRIYAAPTLGAMAAEIESLLAPSRGAAGSASRATAAAAARSLRYVLPDGTEIFHQSEAETRHFYQDIFEHRSYVKHGIRIPDGGCVFDVGANIGLFTLFASRQARDVQIYSFEPAPPLFQILSRNVESHKVRARVFNAGVSDRSKTAELTFYPNSSGMSSFHADLNEEKDVLRTLMKNQIRDTPGQGEGDLVQLKEHTDELLDVRFVSQTFSCPLWSLSEIFARDGIERVDLLKVDVQKCEHEVLAGLRDGDWAKIDQIALELHDVDGRRAQLEELLRGRGYRVLSEQDPLYEGTNIYNLYALRR